MRFLIRMALLNAAWVQTYALRWRCPVPGLRCEGGASPPLERERRETGFPRLALTFLRKGYPRPSPIAGLLSDFFVDLVFTWYITV